MRRAESPTISLAMRWWGQLFAWASEKEVYATRGLFTKRTCSPHDVLVVWAGSSAYRQAFVPRRKGSSSKFFNVSEHHPPRGKDLEYQERKVVLLFHTGFHNKRLLLVIVGTRPIHIRHTYTMYLPCHLSFCVHIFFRVLHSLFSLGFSSLLLAPLASFVRSLTRIVIRHLNTLTKVWCQPWVESHAFDHLLVG